MLVVETIGRIRREHFVQGKSIKEIARDLRLSRNTVRKVLRSEETSFSYERQVQPRPKLGRWKEELDRLLATNAEAPARERLTLIRLFEELRARGYEGGYDAVRRYAGAWAKSNASATASAFVPLTFAPGEAYQFDWSHEIVVLDGVTTIVKVAHVRLCHSRMMFARAYPRETQEMVFDAHERAFAFFRGACGRGIYDNMKTAVETIFVGKDRQYNRRFLQMCSHHLVEPVACSPASGWEKGQVENQVGLVRERFFTPRLRFKSYDELNAWVLDKCLSWAKAHAHPERPEQAIWEVFEEERPKLIPYRGRFDGFHALPASVSKTCLVRFDNNKYSVSASAVGRPVDIHAYADRVVIRQDGRIVAEHRRSYGRGATIYDPWHYVPVLARKPGALRNGAPFKDWVLPAALDRIRRKLAGSNDGDRQMVKILAAVLRRRAPGGRSGMRPGARRQRSFGRCRSQYSGAPTRSGAVGANPHPGVAAVASCAGRRLRPLRPAQECLTHGKNRSARHDERPQALRDEERLRRDADHGDQAQARAPTLRRRSLEGRDLGETGALDQVPAHSRQAAAGQRCRRLRLRGNADQ
jgi:transposase